MEKLDKVLSTFDPKNVSELKAIFESELNSRQEQIVKLSEMHRQATIKEYQSRLDEQEESWQEFKTGLERKARRQVNENRKQIESHFNSKIDTVLNEAVNKAVSKHLHKIDDLVESSKNNAMSACFDEMLKVAGKSLTGLKTESLDDTARYIKKSERLNAERIKLEKQVKSLQQKLVESESLKKEIKELKQKLTESNVKFIRKEVKNDIPVSKRDAFDSMTKDIDFTNESEYRRDLERVARALKSDSSKQTTKRVSESNNNEYSKFI